MGIGDMVFAKPSDLDGTATGNLKIEVEIPHGKGRRRVCVYVPAVYMLAIADAIRSCHHCFEDVSRGRTARTLDEARDPHFTPTAISHAFWHMRHPERPRPCIDERMLATRALEVTEAPAKLPPFADENTCEHGDHPAPPGRRFCSRSCADCEQADAPDGEECAGLCLDSAQPSPGAASTEGGR